MPKAQVVQIEHHGPPEVMHFADLELGPPGRGEVTIRQTAIGFNFIDISQRKGIAPLLLPTGLGHEAVGVVEDLDSSVEEFKIGDRVAYMGAGPGAYATFRTVNAEKLVAVPDGLSDEVIAAHFFKGLTAQYLIQKTFPVRNGHLVLLHAAAGGVGSIVASWASKLGATVIGTVGSDEKCSLAKANGCAFAVNYSRKGWEDEILEWTGGTKVDAVFDSIGKDTFLSSLDLTTPFGTVIVFGMASGPAPAIDPELLNRKGCLFLTRPSIFPHNAAAAQFRENAANLYKAMSDGMFDTNSYSRFEWTQVQDLHRAVEARDLSGPAVIIPQIP
ncbi:quinone oxidoreductase [Mesorhizobium sp. M1396]|uniref:quinone oxidoreductase family protein n=1 Tax=Mesorhizobium sp. M1396 TaxID=2957095 RepID=UPI00333DEF32